MVVGQSSSRIGHATSEREEEENIFHELLEHSLPFGSQWPLCCDTCTALGSLHLGVSPTIWLPPFWLLFLTSFHLVLSLSPLSSFSQSHTHTQRFRLLFSIFFCWVTKHIKMERRREKKKHTAEQMVREVIYLCCWKYFIKAARLQRTPLVALSLSHRHTHSLIHTHTHTTLDFETRHRSQKRHKVVEIQSVNVKRS